MATNQIPLFKSHRSNRIQVGLDDRTLRTLTKFSEVTGYPRSRVVAELLAGITPFMESASEQLEAAQKLGDIGAIASSIESMLVGMRDMAGMQR
jgi:hypothetical protein